MSDAPARVSAEIREQYRALHQAAGFAELVNRTQVEMLGRDRAQLLHGLCTNDIKGLLPSRGCEAFLTNGQGRTIGYVYVFCQPESLVLESVSGAAAAIIQNLDRYVIREDVRFEDRTEAWSEFLICGPQATDRLQALLGVTPPQADLENVAITWGDRPGRLYRVPYAGANGFFLSVERVVAAGLAQQLVELGLVRCQDEVVEMARIEAGTPLFGCDVTDGNLPQEVNRSAQAISFRKGCYLGQETIARLDALGHVNQTLCGMVFSGEEVPPPGAEIRLDGKLAAKVTSACWSLRREAPLALGYVRREHSAPGARLPSAYGEVEVVRVPLE